MPPFRQLGPAPLALLSVFVPGYYMPVHHPSERRPCRYPLSLALRCHLGESVSHFAVTLGSLSPTSQLSLWIALAVGIAIASLASWLSQPFPCCQCTHCDSLCSYARYASARTATFFALSCCSFLRACTHQLASALSSACAVCAVFSPFTPAPLPACRTRARATCKSGPSN